MPKLYYWFVHIASDTSRQATVHVYEDKIEALAKHVEKSKLCYLVSDIHEVLGEENDGRDEGVRWLSRRGFLGKPRRES